MAECALCGCSLAGRHEEHAAALAAAERRAEEAERAGGDLEYSPCRHRWVADGGGRVICALCPAESRATDALSPAATPTEDRHDD